MNVELITKEDLDRLKDDILSEVKAILHENGPSKQTWLRSSQVQELLGICSSTLQNKRINRTIPYSNIDGTLYYKYSDIMQVLEDNYNG